MYRNKWTVASRRTAGLASAIGMVCGLAWAGACDKAPTGGLEPTPSNRGQEDVAAVAEQGAAARADSAPAPVPRVALDEQPVIDLVTNRHLGHLYDPGLRIPVAAAGFYKYTQEYSRPWSDRVFRHEEHVGRILERRVDADLSVDRKG